MRQFIQFSLVAIFIGIALTGFQCSSTEMTSAKLYIQQKNYDRAIVSLQQELEKNPRNDEAFYLMGYIYGEKDNIDSMLIAYEKSLGISKKYEQNIEDSKRLFWANNFNKGVSLFNRATAATEADSIENYFALSITAFETAIKIEPDSSDTYKNLAFGYMNMQRYDDAINPLKKLIELENSIDGYRFLGEIYHDLGVMHNENYKASQIARDSVKAMEYFNKTIELLEKGRSSYPEDSAILLYLSNAYINADKIDVAIDAFRAGVAQDPGNKYYRYNYGVLLLQANDYEKAVEQFKKATEIDPDYFNAIYNTAVAYVRWGAQISKEAEEESKDNVGAIEKYRLALPYLENVVQTKDDEAAIWELLGRVYTVLNMQEEANKAFNKADQQRN